MAVGMTVVPAAPSAHTGTSLRNIRRAMFTSGLSTVIGLPLSLIVTPIVLSNVTKTEYGAFATVASVMALAQLAESGIAAGLVRKVAVANRHGDQGAIAEASHDALSLLWLAALAIVGFGVVAAMVLPGLVLKGAAPSLRHAYPVVVIASMALLAIAMFLGGWFSILGGLQRSDVQRWGDVAGMLTAAGALLICVLAGLGIWSFLISAAAQLVATSLVQAAWLRRLAPYAPLRFGRPTRLAAHGFVGLSFVLFFASVAGIIDLQFDKLIVAHFAGTPAAGTYQIGSTVGVVARGVVILPAGIMLAGVAELLDRPALLLQLERGVIRVTVALTGIVMGGVILFSPAFYRVWLGPGYGQAAFVSQMLALAIIPGCITATWPAYAIGRGWTRPLIAAAVTNIVVNGFLSYGLVASIGFNGALWGSIAGNVAATVVGYSCLVRCERRPWFSPILPSVLMLTVLLLAMLPIAMALPHNWGTVALGGLAWTAICLASLALIGALPVRLERVDGRLRPALVR